jgi:hypothetical protein
LDFLRNLFGNLTSGVIRLAVTAGILFCAYLFIVKPALDTTRDISKEANDSIQQSFRASGLNDISQTFDEVNRQVQREIRRSFSAAKANGGNPQRLLRCIRHANQNVEKIERCTRRF